MNKIRIAGAAAGVVLVSGVVMQVSSAAFTDTTENAGNEWEAGTVSLTDNDLGTAMYATVSNISPGYTEKQCIEVTYGGTVTPDIAIELYAASSGTAGGPDDVAPVGPDGDGLHDDLNVTIEIGPATSKCNLAKNALTDATGALPAVGTSIYSGTVAAFNDALNPDTTGWTPDGDGGTDLTRPFLFTVTLPGDAANDGQGDTANATFTWSATA